MLPYYFEYHYRGNPGFYRSYYLGVTPSGYVPEGLLADLKHIMLGGPSSPEAETQWRSEHLRRVRAEMSPNTFVVTAKFAKDVINYLNRQGVGPNWLDIREFP